MAGNDPTLEAQEGLRRAFPALLNGSPESIEARNLGKFAEAYTGLLDIFHQHGLEATRKAFAVLATSDKELATLAASDRGPPSPTRYTVHWAREALEPQPEKDWIIEGLMAAGDVVIMVGEGGSKKTFLELDAGICVAQGRPWLDFQTRQGTVLLVDEESGIDRLNRRLGRLMRAHEAGSDTPLAYISLESVNLLEELEANELEKLIEELGARFVGIDALVDIMLGADENAAKEIQPVFHRLRKIAANQKCGIMLIHHTNKAGGYRGSSAIKGAIDVMLIVESKPASSLIKIASDKNRDDFPSQFTAQITFEPEKVVISVADSDESEIAESPKLGKPASYVLRFLRDHGASLLADIEARADTCAARSARDAVYDLTAKGFAQRTDIGNQGSAATYGLTAKGVETAKSI